MYLLLDKLYSSEGNVCYVFLNLETQRLYYHVNHKDTYTPRMIVENLPDKVIHERLKIERQSRKEKYVEKLSKGEDDWHLRDQPWTIILPIEKYDSILNRMVQLKEIHFSRPQGVPAYRGLFESWEDNIQFLTRHGIDNQMPMGMIWDEMEQNTFPRCIPFSDKKIIDFLTEYGYDKRIIDHFVPLLSAPLDFHIERVAIDIETQYDATLKPNAEVAAFPIVSISVVSNREGELPTIFTLRENYREEGIPHENLNILDIRLFDKERDLLKAFFKYMRRQPQILITYHGDNFDLPYIKNRCMRLGFSEKEIPIHVATSKKKKGTTKGFTGGIARWKGKIHLDIYRFFENISIKNYTFQAKYRDVSLDEVSKALLGRNKIKIDDMNKLSTYDLIWYNYIDSDLTLQLTAFNHDLTLKVMIALMRMTNSTMPDINRFGISTWAHNMLFSFMIQNKILIPNMVQLNTLMKTGTSTEAIVEDALYRGGQLDVIKGYYFDIVIIDFTGLYPNVCSKKNICWSTISCSHPECESHNVPDSDYWTCTKEKGILSQIMGLLKDVRAEIYKPLGKTGDILAIVIEQSQKVLVNATLGVFGNTYAKLFCPAITACVTGHSRHAINTAEKIADSHDLICVYKHTDSTSLIKSTGGRIGDKTVEQLLKEINTVLNLEMELEHRFQFMIVHSKANYLGVKEGAKTAEDVVIRGMMGKKRNVPDIVKGIFNKVKEQLIPIKNEETLEQQRKIIIKLIRESIEKIKNKEGSIEDYSMRIGLNKDISQYTKTTPQHVKVAKQITKYKRENEGVEGTDDKIVPKGSIIEYVHVLRPCKVETILTANKNNINVAKYITILKSTLQQIIENIHITDLDLQGIEQTNIGDFFK